MPGTKVTVVEVAPRDGLQSDPAMLDASTKVELIRRLVGAGFRRIETVSFVNPDRVPQMADAEAVMAALLADDATRSKGAAYIGLVLNHRGLARAVDAGVDEINSVVVCTDTFARRNQGRDTDGLIEEAAAICEGARSHGIPVTVTLTAAFGCPFEGELSASRFADVFERVVAIGPNEIALADSIGAAVPADVRERLAIANEIIGDQPIALRAHFHNTRNTGIANSLTAVESGVNVIDASLGGIGGCPFAPAATGNVPSEDLLYLLERSGWNTGVDLAAACEVVPWLASELGHEVPGYLSKAGIFPQNARGSDPE